MMTQDEIFSAAHVTSTQLLESAIDGTKQQALNALNILEETGVQLLGSMAANLVEQNQMTMDELMLVFSQRIKQYAERVVEGIETGDCEKVAFKEEH